MRINYAIGMLEAIPDTTQVAACLGTSDRSVSRLRNRNQQSSSVKDRPRCGMSKVTTHAENRRMCVCVCF